MAVAIVLLLIVVIIYIYLKWNYSYWKRTGLEQIEPVFFYGNIKDLLLGRISFAEYFQNTYNVIKSKGLKHGGIYQMLQPTYIPTDLRIIKNILQKDFSYFINHIDYVNEEADPLTGHLFALENDKWKTMRTKLSPAFTSGKMKMMLPTMVCCTEGVGDILESSAKLNDAVDIKDLMSRFSIDVIGSAAFGIDCNCLKNPDSEFRRFSNKVFEPDMCNFIKFLVSAVLPKKFLSLIRFKRTNSAVEDFFMKVVKSTTEYREKNNIFRKDLIHLLLQLKNRGKVTDDEDVVVEEDKNHQDCHYLTLNEVVAQCFGFMIAGYETAATTSTFALLELAKNPDIQEKVRQEIATVLEQHNDQITYEALMEMKYLDKVINETLRLYPAASVLTRKCNARYQVPDTDVIIEPGVAVIISLFGIHRDPEYYPNPEKFDPERFNEENEAERPKFTFLPFGEGSRICIGAKFGLMETKIGIVAVLRNFKVSLSSKTKLPIKYAFNTILTCAEGDVWLNIHVAG